MRYSMISGHLAFVPMPVHDCLVIRQAARVGQEVADCDSFVGDFQVFFHRFIEIQHFFSLQIMTTMAVNCLETDANSKISLV